VTNMAYTTLESQVVTWGGIACLGMDDITSDAQQRAQEAVNYGEHTDQLMWYAPSKP
jgi:hypothetical protein